MFLLYMYVVSGAFNRVKSWLASYMGRAKGEHCIIKERQFYCVHNIDCHPQCSIYQSSDLPKAINNDNAFDYQMQFPPEI